jgi:hypothetical protein
MYDFSTSFVHCIWIYGNKNDDDHSYTQHKIKVNDQLDSPTTLLPAKHPLVSIVQEAGWALEPIWMLWSSEKSLAPTRY